MRFLLLFLCIFSAGCAQYGKLKFVAELPDKINECSGIVSYGDESIWLIEDGGNDDALYQVGFDGSILSDLEVDGGANDDWEDLAKDTAGNIYIADTGNNSRNRDDFTIHKLPDPRVEKGDKIPAEDIDFTYPKSDNDETPDAEAIFHHRGFLYIVTRDRGNPFTGEANIYRVPDEAGSYTAEFIGSFTTCDQRGRCEITAATISGDGQTLVLLSLGKLWVVRDPGDLSDLQERLESIDLGANTQLESISFKDDKTLLIADEERAGDGGNLYQFILD